MEIRNFRCEIRAAGPKIRGIIPYNSLSEDLGGFKEMVDPGAFAATLQDGSTVHAFWQHDSKQPLGNTRNKTLQLQDAPDGLRFTIDPPSTSWGKDALESASRGDLMGVSFGFTVRKDEWKDNIRHLVDVNLREISPVTTPAYPGSKIYVRSNKNMNINELYTERGRINEEMRRFEAFDRLDATQEDQYSRLENEFRGLTQRIRQAEGEERNRFMAALQCAPIKPEPEKRSTAIAPKPGEIRVYSPGTFRIPETPTNAVEERDFKEYVQRGMLGLTDEQRARLESRALQMDKDTSGGFAVSPELFVNQFIASLIDQVFIRQYATIITCPNAHSLGAPALDNDVGDPEWGSELNFGSEDSTMSFDKRELTPHPLARYIKVSKKLIRANPQVDGLIRDRLSARFAIVEENKFLNGSGANQPLGIFTASALGIGTSRDMSTGNTATGILPDNLVNCKYHLRAQYRRNARWVFSRDGIKMIRKLKDGEGNYIWKLGLSADRPDTILDLPFDESEYCPNVFTTGQYVGALCNWQFYWIADALSMEIQVLTELFAATNQNGYVGRKETDAMPVLEEAFVRVKLG